MEVSVVRVFRTVNGARACAAETVLAPLLTTKTRDPSALVSVWLGCSPVGVVPTTVLVAVSRTVTVPAG